MSYSNLTSSGPKPPMALNVTSVVANSINAAADVAGVASQTSLSNVVNTTQGAGSNVVKSTDGSNHNNTGYIKMYVGTTAVYVPYWATP